MRLTYPLLRTSSLVSGRAAPVLPHGGRCFAVLVKNSSGLGWT